MRIFGHYNFSLLLILNLALFLSLIDYTGQRCETAQNQYSTCGAYGSCLNGGTCTQLNPYNPSSGYYCSCPLGKLLFKKIFLFLLSRKLNCIWNNKKLGYSGNRCEISMTTTTAAPISYPCGSIGTCANGGTCVSSQPNPYDSNLVYSCKCPPSKH